jgi:hypothetical protein
MVSRARCFLMVIEITIHIIVVSPLLADTIRAFTPVFAGYGARPLSRQEMPNLPAAPLTQRLASGPPKPQNQPPFPLSQIGSGC